MSWFKFKEKIKFYWQAKNAHGLHSPFIFTFYNSIKKQSKNIDLSSEKQNGFTKKENRIILAILQYLKPINTLILSDEEQVTRVWNSILLDKSQVFLAQSLDILAPKPINFDLIILSNPLLINTKVMINHILPLISNESIVIIPHLYASKNSIKQWKSLIEEKSVRVSIDLFFIGILFFRRESSKQDFQLRF